MATRIETFCRRHDYDPVHDPYGNKDPEVIDASTGVFKRVLMEKEALKDKALANKWDRYNPIIIGGDAFTMATFAFEGAKTLMPQVSSIAAVAVLTTICGVVAGVINIGVGAICFKESMQAFYNGDTLLGLRLLIDAVTITAIGVVMILIGLSTQVAALGVIGAFFQANPWILPVLFFIISIPVILEISRRIGHIYSHTDLASKLELKKVEDLIESKDFNDAADELFKKLGLDPSGMTSLTREDPSKVFGQVSEAMEKLQAEMGVEAALAVFKLILALREEEEELSLAALTKAKEEIKAWNTVQHVRLFQQFLYTLAFVASMVVLSPGLGGAATTITATQQISMSAANLIPTIVDATLPFKRNPPIVVPKVDTPKEESEPVVTEVSEEASEKVV